MYTLKSPGGHLIAECVGPRRKDVWGRAERFFRSLPDYRLLRDYQAAARRRGWIIVEVFMVEKHGDDA